MNAPQTLTDLQAEREQIKAAQARDDFEAAMAATCSAADLLAAGQAVRRLLLDALDVAGARLLEPLEGGERDETRVHYLLSEAAHLWATELGDAVAREAAALPALGARFKRGITPRELLPVSRWADKHRELEGGTNMPGRWVTDRTPYLREIMDSLSEHSDVSEVIFVKAVQVGATEVLFNWIGYVMHHLRNKDMLVVVPTKEFRNQKFNPRLGRVIRESAALKDLVSFSSRSSKNTEDVLEYGGGAKIVKAGANVGTDLSSDSIPYVACDEVDKFPAEIPGFGDPMGLIRGRQTTHTRAKSLKVSSPLLEETSRIWAEWLNTDMRRYYLPCPHCGELQHLEWGGEDKPYGLKFERALRREGEEGPPRVDRAWYVCRHSGCIIEETEKPDMLARGRWIAERPYVTGRRGYHINALYAPPGLGLPWRKLAEEHLASLGDTAAMQTFKNERLGLPWKEDYDAADPLAIMARLEDYGTLPDWLVRSVGIDVQGDWIEVSHYAWGLDEECWSLNHYIIPGQTITAEPWNELAELLAELRPHCGGLDTGYNADMAYAFARSRPWLYPIKGVDKLDTNTLVEADDRRKARLRRRAKTKGVSPFRVSNLVGMQAITERLNLPVPEASKRQAKFIHFPAGVPAFDIGFFKQLTSNRKVTKKVRHRVVVEWKESKPNEAYDCWKYSLAGFLLSKIDPASRMREAQKVGAGEAVKGGMLANWGRG